MSSARSLGTYLRRRRERSGLSVEEVSTGSRIVPRLVDALEADRQDLLPAPVYVRGFIRAYCAQVGVDPEEALRLYEERAGPPPPLTVKPPVSPRPTPRAGRRWSRVAVGALLLAALGVAGVFALGRRQPDAGPSHRTARAATASRAPSAPASEVSTASTPSAPSSADRVLVLRAIEATWVRVKPDGGEATEETLAPGTVREWHSAGRFHVTLGNGGGVEIELNGQTLPALGERGRVVRDVIVPSETEP